MKSIVLVRGSLQYKFHASYRSHTYTFNYICATSTCQNCADHLILRLIRCVTAPMNSNHLTKLAAWINQPLFYNDLLGSEATTLMQIPPFFPRRLENGGQSKSSK